MAWVVLAVGNCPSAEDAPHRLQVRWTKIRHGRLFAPMPFNLRKPRFTLLALMAIMTLALGGLVAWRAARLRHRESVIAELQASGAVVSVDLGPLVVDSVAFAAPLTDRQFELVEQLGKLDALSLPAVDLSEEEVERLCRCEPSYLEFSSGMLSQESLDRIVGLKSLEQLWIKEVRFDGGRSLKFANPEGLRCLATTEGSVNDQFLGSLEKCVNLEELIVDNAQITDPGLASLYKLKQPIQLSFRRTAITDQGIVPLLQAVYGTSRKTRPFAGTVVRLEGIDVDPQGVKRIREAAFAAGLEDHLVRFDEPLMRNSGDEIP